MFVKRLFLIKEFLNKILPGVSICIFSFFTICGMFFSHLIPGEAEAHAWTIAGNVNILQLIDLMNAEGHFLIWYLCLMPFAKFPSLYPWVMYIINWVFCLIALYILWEKAPFNNFTKMCITFSAPFFRIYSIYPRCYSIGILFLFLALSFYKDRFNKPYKYLITLTAAANTSLPACIAAGILGIMFLYDLFIKKCDKRYIYVSLAVAFLNLILFYFQFHNAALPDYEAANTNLIKGSAQILAFLGDKNINIVNHYKIILAWAGAVILPIFLWKSKRAFLFFLSSELIMLLFFSFVYGARVYHMFFFFIFTVIAFWIYNTEKGNEDIFSGCLLLFISLCMVFINVRVPYNQLENLYPVIISDENLTKGKLYTNYGPIYVSVALPYLAKNNKTIYDLNGKDLNSYDVLKNYFDKSKKEFNVDNFLGQLDTQSRNFIILDGIFKYNHIDGTKYSSKIIPYKSKIMEDLKYDSLHIYEITNVRKIK